MYIQIKTIKSENADSFYVIRIGKDKNNKLKENYMLLLATEVTGLFETDFAIIASVFFLIDCSLRNS